MYFKNLCAILAVSILGGCGEKVGCSEPATLDAIQKIARQSLMKDQSAVAILEIDKVTVKLDVVRTRQKTEKTASCAAKLLYNIEVRTGALGSGDDAAIARVKRGMEQQMDADITYEVEKLDAQSGVYVTVSGLNF